MASALFVVLEGLISKKSKESQLINEMVNDDKSWVLSYLTALGTDYVLGDGKRFVGGGERYGLQIACAIALKCMRIESGHEIIRFFTKRIKCSCLKEKYRQAKSEESKMGTCFHCQERKERKDLKVCGTCKLGQYCSKACQKAAWSEHKNVCTQC